MKMRILLYYSSTCRPRGRFLALSIYAHTAHSPLCSPFTPPACPCPTPTCYGPDPFVRIAREAPLPHVPPTPPHLSEVVPRRETACVLTHSCARAFPRFCFRVHSGLYYDGSAFCRPAPCREAAHVTTYWAGRHPRRTLHPPQVSSGRLRISRGCGANPFSLLPRGLALRTSTSGTSPSSRGTCCC